MAMMIVEKPQYVLLQWAADKLRIPNGMWVPDSKAYGVVDGKEIRAVMVLNHFSGEGCEVSFVSDGSKSWATPEVAVGLIQIPFEIFNLSRVVAHISPAAIDTQIFALRFGWQFEARLRAGMPDGSDAILFSMMRDEQPVLAKKEV